MRPEFGSRDQDQVINFWSHGVKTETKTFILGLMGSRPISRLSFWVTKVSTIDFKKWKFISLSTATLASYLPGLITNTMFKT